MSKIEVDKIDPQSGTALEIGTSGDTVTVPSGVGLTLTDSTLLLPTTITSTTEVKTNKISPATGTAFTLGDSGDTFTVPSGATILNSGTATGFGDTTAIENDIATLALHQATNANAAKYNLVNTNVDQYEDSTGVASFTDCARDTAGEYVSSVYGSVGPRFATTKVGSAVYSTAQQKFGTGSLYNASNAGDYLKTGTLTGLTGMPTTGNWTIECWAKYAAVSISGTERILGVGDGSTTGVNNHFSFGYQSTTTNMNFYEVETNHTDTGWPARDTDWHHYLIQGVGSGTNYAWYDGVYQYSYTNASSNLTGLASTFLQMGGRTNSSTEDFVGYIDEVRLSNIYRHTNGVGFTAPTSAYTTDANTMALLHMDTSDLVDSSLDTSVDNATGNYVSTATTANASVTTMGAVITYKNEDGTNTLNTDIIIEVSADGGSNYTTATLTAGGTFSTGILQAVANDITVTAGTSIQYRISFANQSDGVKVAQIYGVSLMY